ncbi:Vacuolar protein sorting-associated protein 62 [Gnomoniopsis smithogilvyi]|uniref:Vacuolar protein sorting-associated protein 62 n=1 Tax=Gnomoniopsis smithogilvyi TaxID=1191159 RepID=A0A9W8Z2L9_9PEZI|nr:Vacuolar protein sorting-associated protein 62 [Gnomoniopsis smithogilvyi]
MYHLRRAIIAAAIIAILVFITWFVPKALNPTPPSPEQAKADKAWIDSSPYWLDRQACRWFSVCGIHHMRWDDPVKPRGPPMSLEDLKALGELELKRRALLDSSESWQDLRKRGRIYEPGQKLDDVPDFVLRNAPLVHLYSEENFWPSDIAEHVQHMTPYFEHEPANMTESLSLANMFDLTAKPGVVFLTSNEDVEQRPEWLSSHVSEPTPFDENGDEKVDPADGHEDEEEQKWYSEGTTWWNVDKDHPLHRISDPRERSFEPRDMIFKHTRRAQIASEDPQKPMPPPPGTPGHKPDASGYSKAPAVLVLVDKGSGILDVFWFFFYSYNLGQTVLNMRFGNHVGDWEHCMVRFENGVPRAMFLSEHEGGQAYAWAALEKKRMNVTSNVAGELVTAVVERPVIYSAVGSHAMYAFPGPHPYVLPFQMLKDDTDRGPLWDPSLNNYAYFYDYKDSPPPPEEDEGSPADEVTPEEWSPYPFNTTVLTTHAKRSSNLNKRGELVAPTSLVPASSNPDAPTSWFHFDGPWGDEIYSLGDERQWRLFGQYHYVTGPMGPKFKRLGRETVCQSEKCRMLYSIEEGRKSSWHD